MYCFQKHFPAIYLKYFMIGLAKVTGWLDYLLTPILLQAH
ncbi:MAG: hypothetical protein JXQ90_11560 [Cyclobacteriaceae bacterium]